MAETRLTLRTPNRRPLTVLVDAPLVVGRDCDGLILPDQRVSRRHTMFEPVSGPDGGLRVTDLDSSNGTTVNGTRVNGPTTIGPGDTVTIGNTTITLDVGASTPGGGSGAGAPTELVTPDPSTRTSIELVAEAVGETGIGSGTDAIGPEVIGVDDEPGTLTVVFSDIESSTTLAVAMGDARWMALLGHHHRLVTAHVDAHRGRIVKNQGDGYMLCFRSARQALLASIGLQRDLEREPGLPDDWERPDGVAGLRVRIGAHTGEVMMQDDGDLFGKHVIVAARVGALAAGGQILVSNLVKQIAEPRGDIAFGAGVEVELKGIAGRTEVHDVDWRRWDDEPADGARGATAGP